jgi:hypothetical protein
MLSNTNMPINDLHPFDQNGPFQEIELSIQAA